MGSIRLGVLSIGDTPLPPLERLVTDLEGVLRLSTVRFSTRLALPEEAWEDRRGQFLAPRLLALLRQVKPRAGEGTLLLGISNADLYAPGLSFVFGQADMLGGVAVVSLSRLYPAFHARPHDGAVFRRRAAIEGVHEVGHLLGLPHCADRHCVMFFSSGIADSDRKGPLFCPACRIRVDLAVGTPAEQRA